MSRSTCLLPKVLLIAAVGFAIVAGSAREIRAQDDGVVPASYQSGSFFDRRLGTALRFNYHTRGYGTQDDVFSLGGMKVFNGDGSAVFVDGQGTLSDDFGGGFNLGVGYRQLTSSTSPIMQIDPERILGIGFWTDGQSTAADNFFTQLGFNLESLGESFDTRLSGYFPLERNKAGDAVLASTGTPFYVGNNIFGATERFTVDTALTVIDSEFAKRIGDLEAWAFCGAYYLNGGIIDDGGYRVGVRGYAVPDLALSLQVTDDNVYDTNVMFGMTWFIGRTHRGNGPCGTLLDRFREPVLRNDFIAMVSRQRSQASGNPLTDPTTNEAIRVVHIDDDGGGAGDGTFENPFDQVSDINAAIPANVANSQEGDILLVHSSSTFTGADGVATLQANQQLLGEGTDPDGNPIPHIVATNELGLINLPETAPGSQALGRPAINAAGMDVFTLADGSLVNNFTINGAGSAVTADGVAAPTGSMLANLQVNGATNGIFMQNTTGTVVVENTVAINDATGTALEVNGGDNAYRIAASINDSRGRSLVVQGRTGGTVDYTGTITDDAANTSQGVLIRGNTDATVNLTNTQNIHAGDGADAFRIDVANTNTTVNASGEVNLTATGTGDGLVIDGNADTSAITFADLRASAVNGDTVSIDDGGTVSISAADDARTIANTGTGNALFNRGGTAVVTVNSNITNAGGGQAVEIRDRTANDVTIAGTVTVENGSAAGLLVEDNTDGIILFSNTLNLNTGANHAVLLTNNGNGVTDATISFTDLDIDTTTGNGFSATAGGNLIVTSTNGTNDINVARTGTGLALNGMTIDPANVTFDVVSVGTQAGFTGAGTGIDLQNLDGTGQVVVGGGTNAGDGGILMTDGTAINVDNANNVALTNLSVSNVGAAEGVTVSGQQTGSLASFTGLEVATVNADAVNVNGNDGGAISFGTLTATTTGNGDGIEIDNADGSAVTISINGATVNANGLGRGFAATGGGTTTMVGTNVINSTGGTAFDVNNVENLTASGVTINNTAARGVNVTGQNANADVVTLNNFNVTTTTAEAVRVADNSNGTILLTGLTAESTSGDTLAIDNNAGATVSINGMDLTSTSGTAFSATNGGTLIATGTNNVSTITGRGVNIDGLTIDAADVAFTSVNVPNANGTAINLNTLTGGQVRVNGGALTANAAAVGAAVVVNDVDDAALSNLDINYAASTAAGVMVTNSAGDALTLTNVDVATSSGAGVDVDGGTFAATGTNTIATTAGVGLDLRNATLGAGGANFNRVNVTNGSTNGVVLSDLSGGRVRVGSPVATGTNGAGGTLTTAGEAISVTGVTDAVFNDLAVVSSTAVGAFVDHNLATASSIVFNNLGVTTVAGSGNGVVVNDNGAGELDFTLQDSTVDVALGDTIGFTLVTAANTGEIDIRLNGNTIIANNSSAVLADLNAGTGDVQFLVNGGNDWSNSSAASATASFLLSTGRTLNATIGDQDGTAPFDENRFTNSNGLGTAFAAQSNSAAATLSLDLRGNTAIGGASDFLLTETLGTFGIVDLTATVTNQTNNTPTVDLGGGGVEADFDDLVPPIKQVD